MTKIIFKKDIDLLVKELKKGKIVAFPTDTVFGLGCIYDDLNAIEKIFIAKNRDLNKSLPMMCNNLKMINEYAFVDNNSKKIIKEFMPGALTIILNKKEIISHIGDKDTIAIRIPDDYWIRELIKKLKKPLLVTSANISNEESLIDYLDVYHKLNNRIDYIVKGKALNKISSTIVDVREDLKILREGKIKEKDIRKILK